MVKMTLQEQLLKAGLVNQSQLRTAKTEKHKQAKDQRHTKQGHEDKIKQEVQQKQAEQAAKDRELNLIQQQADARKQLGGQIRQLIKQNRLALPNPLTAKDDEICAYRFTDCNKVKVLYVAPSMRDEISQGRLAIVKQGERFQVVPVEIGKKIKELDAACVFVLNEISSDGQKTDDPYASYEVPDDLMW